MLSSFKKGNTMHSHLAAYVNKQIWFRRGAVRIGLVIGFCTKTARLIVESINAFGVKMLSFVAPDRVMSIVSSA